MARCKFLIILVKPEYYQSYTFHYYSCMYKIIFYHIRMLNLSNTENLTRIGRLVSKLRKVDCRKNTQFPPFWCDMTFFGNVQPTFLLSYTQFILKNKFFSQSRTPSQRKKVYVLMLHCLWTEMCHI